MKTELVRELLYLWEGVYPYLADFVLELYGRGGGDFLEVGPFSCLLYPSDAADEG